MLRIKNCDRLFKRLLSDINDVEILKSNVLGNISQPNELRDYSKPKFWNLFNSTPEYLDQSSSTIFLFPGQGTQFVGMGKNLLNYPRVSRLYESASDYLKYDLLKLCLEGPEDKLNKTIHCQPATYVTSLAILEKIREEEPELIENCIATAGQSLGEITSLVFSGVLSFEAGLHFIRVRAELMERACLKFKSAMLVVSLSSKSQLSAAIQAAKQYCYEKLGIESPVCQISTYLFTECKVIGGHLEAIEFIESFASEFKLRSTKRLKVAGAFHTPLMAEAVSPCRNALSRIGPIGTPQINTLSNVTGSIHVPVANEIKRLLVKQICSPVLWEQILMRLYMRPATHPHPTTIEIGPGQSLATSIKRVNLTASEKYKHVGA